jgi:hypothetical protein
LAVRGGVEIRPVQHGGKFGADSGPVDRHRDRTRILTFIVSLPVLLAQLERGRGTQDSS